MSDRIQRMLIGFSLMFGLQMIVAWAAKVWLGITSDNDNITGILLICNIAVYFGGGLVMGLLSEKIIWSELLLVTSLAVVSNILFFVIGAAQDLTFISIALHSNAPALQLVLNCSLVLLCVVAGVFTGVRIKMPTDDWISRGIMLMGFFSLIIGPYLLLSASGKGQAGLPWYVLAIIALALLAIVATGYMLSNRKHTIADEMSISPDHHQIL